MADDDRVIQGYARALFSVAEAEGSLDEVEDQLYQFAKTVEREGGLREALIDPQLPADRKRSVLEAQNARRHRRDECQRDPLLRPSRPPLGTGFIRVLRPGTHLVSGRPRPLDRRR